MTDANGLQKAYELIEADKLDEARTILEPIVAVENDNADAWWLYAHAVNDPVAARGAIQNVLRIDPEYPEAASLLSVLEKEAAVLSSPPALTQPPLKTIKSLGSTGATSTSELSDDETPDFSLDDDEIDFDDALPDESEADKSRLPLPLPVLTVLLVVGIIIIGLIIAAILTPPGTPPTDATSVAGITDEPTLEGIGELATSTPEEPLIEPSVEVIVSSPESPGSGEEPVETEISADGQSAASPTPENEGDETTAPTSEGETTDETGDEIGSTEEAEDQLTEALGDFTLGQTPVETTETELGNTVIISICSTPEELRTTAFEAMEVVADNSDAFSDVDAFAVSISDCDNGTTLRTLGVSRQDALDYAAGDLSASEFQTSWQPLN